MKRENAEMHPDLSARAWTIGCDNTTDLAWAYPDTAPCPAAPTDIDHLALPAEWDKKRMAWLLIGPPNPVSVKSMLSRISPCSQLIVCDPAPPLHTALDAAARQQLARLMADERLHVVTGGSAPQRSVAAVRLIDIDHYDGWKPVVGQTLMDADTQGVAELMRGISTALNVRVLSKSTTINMGVKFLRNALLNAPWAHQPRPLETHRDRLQNRPALIVSAGPSLNKQLPLLAEYQDLFCIIAVDTVWPILKTHGIVPDYLCALDPVTPASWPRNGLDPGTRFVTDVMAAPAMVWSHANGHLMTSSHDPIARLYDRLGAHTDPLVVGGSVATQAFNLAVELGANPIVFIGQDLALTGGKDHADGYLYTYDDSTLKDRSESGYDVEGYHGGRVRTERQLLSYKYWFEHRIGGLQDRMVINATEGGARIAGTLQIPFAQICKEIASTSLRKPPHEPALPSSFDAAHIRRLLDGVNALAEKVQAYRSLAEQGQALTEESSLRKKDKTLKRIDRLNQQLRDFDPEAKALINAMGARRLEKTRRDTHIQSQSNPAGAEAQLFASALERYREVYLGIEESADACQSLLEEVRGLYQQVLDEERLDLSQLDGLLS